MILSPPQDSAKTGTEPSGLRPTSQEIDQLVQKYTENLMRASFGLGFNEQEAEELVQDTFVAYLDGAHRFKGKSQLLTYLFGILYNKARASRRLRDREQNTEAIEEVFDNHFNTGGDWLPDEERRLSEPEKHTHIEALTASLRLCLEGLTANLRMAFTLKEVEGTDTGSICEILGVTPTHLGVCLFRARNKLRECLMAKGVSIL
jgi:RNA polymerase sigma-70 factor (ECF subfamily)